jgi:hypothetical protein
VLLVRAVSHVPAGLRMRLRLIPGYVY